MACYCDVTGRPRQLRALKMSHIVFWSRNVTSQGRAIVPTRHAVSIVEVQQCVLQPAVELTRCFYDALCFTTSHGMPLLCHTTRCVVCLHKYAFVTSHKILKLCHSTRRRAHTTISWQHKKAFLRRNSASIGESRQQSMTMVWSGHILVRYRRVVDNIV